MRINYLKTTILILFVLIAIPDESEAQETLSLQDAITLGLENNYKIQIKSNDVEIAHRQNTWGNAGAYPSLTLNVNANSDFMDLTENSDRAGRLTPSVQLNWVLFDGFAIRIRKDKLDYLSQLSEGNAAVVIENTIQAIILAYYDVQLQQERLALFQQVMKLSEDRYNYIQNRVDMGAGSTYESLQAKTAWLTDKSLYLNQEMVVRSAHRLLGYLLALPNQNNFTLSDSLEPVINEYELAGLVSKMEASNQTLQNQYLNLQLLERNIALEQSERYPSLSLNSRGQYDAYPDFLNNPASSSSSRLGLYSGLSLSYNISSGNRVNRNIAIARIQQATGDIQLADMKHQLNSQLINLHDLFGVRKELVYVAEENLAAAQLNLDISTEKYRNGVINSFNFRDVQRTYLQTALSKLNAVFNLIETHTDLVRITGGMIGEYETN